MNIESRLTALENAVEAIHQRLTELEKKAAKAKAVKCEYLGCNKDAETTAIGGDESGNEHVYLVCREHAKELEPYSSFQI